MNEHECYFPFFSWVHVIYVNARCILRKWDSNPLNIFVAKIKKTKQSYKELLQHDQDCRLHNKPLPFDLSEGLSIKTFVIES